MKKIKNSDLWGLHDTLAKIILPYLIAFKKINTNTYTGKSHKEWHKVIDKMIFAMKWIATDDKRIELPTDKQEKEIQEGCELFGKYFRDLWD